jgi:predicted amidohydrolase YtcJ
MDVKGKTVVPGLTDWHYHVFEVGQHLLHLAFDPTTTRAAVLARVRRAN